MQKKCRSPCSFKALSTLTRFQTKTVWKRSCLAPFSKQFASTLIVFVSFSPSTLQRRIRFENAVIPSVRMLKWTRLMCISINRPAKLARNWRHVMASVRRFGYSRSSGLAPGRVYFWWGHRFQIASFSPSTLQNRVFKKHRFQIAPLWRAFSNGSVFGDRFRRCSVDDSRIRSKTAPFSFEKEYWGMPKAIKLRNRVNEQNNGYAHEQNKTIAKFTGKIKIHFLLRIVLSDEDVIAQGLY